MENLGEKWSKEYLVLGRFQKIDIRRGSLFLMLLEQWNEANFSCHMAVTLAKRLSPSSMSNEKRSDTPFHAETTPSFCSLLHDAPLPFCFSKEFYESLMGKLILFRWSYTKPQKIKYNAKVWYKNGSTEIKNETYLITRVEYLLFKGLTATK